MICETCASSIIWLCSPKATANGRPLERGYMNHHLDIFKLKHAALVQKCYICFLIWSYLPTEMQAINESNHKIEYCTSYFLIETTKVSPVMKKNLWSVYSVYSSPGSSKNITGSAQCMFTFTRLTNDKAKERDIMVSSTQSDGTMQIAKDWISECLQNHKSCNEARTRVYQVPTRVLQIEGSIVKLVFASELAAAIDYGALSYCWGSAQFLTLTSETFDRIRGGISVLDLPQSHSNAVQVCQKLGIEYLWIDSLCIKQDSLDDWAQECGRMADVYACAKVNISALASSNSEGGLFRKRDPERVFPGYINTEFFWEGEGASMSRRMIDGLVTYRIQRDETWERETEDAPAFDRGWILQERLLAPRVLYFGANQILWECCELAATEADPAGIPGAYFSTDHKLKEMPRVTADKKEFVTRDIMKSWGHILAKYSVMKLTQPNDKLPAISGIAKKIKRLLIQVSSDYDGVRYLAGLWDFNLHEHLTWRVHKGTRPTEYRAPSWSWASVEGRIRYGFKFGSDDGTPVASIEEVVVNLATSDSMGQVAGGYLRLRGPLRDLVIGDHFGSVYYCIRHPSGFDVDIFLDTQMSYEEQQDLHYMALLVSGRVVKGLILQRTGIKRQFRRVGYIASNREWTDDENWALGDESLLKPKTGQCVPYCYAEGTDIYDIEVI